MQLDLQMTRRIAAASHESDGRQSIPLASIVEGDGDGVAGPIGGFCQ
jgi:hypothetical protein